jgi:hypothetical protein
MVRIVRFRRRHRLPTESSELRRARRLYDERAPTYDRTVALAERVVVGDFRRAFGAALRGRTLEVAIGSGLSLPFYGSTVADAVGVDLSVGMPRLARGRANERGRPLGLAQMDAQRLAFRAAAFDTVAVSPPSARSPIRPPRCASWPASAGRTAGSSSSSTSSRRSGRWPGSSAA